MKIVRFLVALVIAGIGWLSGGLGLGSVLADRASFQNLTPEEFASIFQTATGAAALVCLVLVWAWFVYGDRPAAAANLNAAKGFWWILFLLTAAVWFAEFGYLVFALRNESVGFPGLALALLAGALATWVPYWVTSLVVSPSHVKYVVWPRS